MALFAYLLKGTVEAIHAGGRQRRAKAGKATAKGSSWWRVGWRPHEGVENAAGVLEDRNDEARTEPIPLTGLAGQRQPAPDRFVLDAMCAQAKQLERTETATGPCGDG
ncbi:MAG: hypothetical protein OXB98_06780 [Bryobacterales bacterium]|nr:hypothetical protein [Bryobacterales bacterium]